MIGVSQIASLCEIGYDAPMEMKISVARDTQMIMAFLAAESTSDLDDIWKEHEWFATDFDTFADAILEGAKTVS